jgi:hypothetical protein
MTIRPFIHAIFHFFFPSVRSYPYHLLEIVFSLDLIILKMHIGETDKDAANFFYFSSPAIRAIDLGWAWRFVRCVWSGVEAAINHGDHKLLNMVFTSNFDSNSDSINDLWNDCPLFMQEDAHYTTGCILGYLFSHHWWC